MTYIDGFVAAVPLANKEGYVAFAANMSALFQEHGALSITENWGDDVPDGELTSFPMAVKCEEGEAVVFSWIKWPSKAARDAAWPKIMEDPRMQTRPDGALFDGKRMIYGGFETVFESPEGLT